MQAAVSAQLPRIGDVAGKLKNKGPSLSSLMDKQPITTSLPDARWGDPSKDGFVPPGSPAPLTSLSRTLAGGFVLRQGYFVMPTQSYCLKAGAHGPGGGDGYLYAPPRGPAEDAVVSIVRNSVRVSDIPQHDIQVLLWAIIARAKFEDLSPSLKATASRLLTPQQIATLNRSGLDAVPKPVMQKLIGEAPAGVRQTLEAESNLRHMLTGGSTAFADIERVAMLTGTAPLGEGSIGIPSGRWSLHPDGYYIRYIPSGYSLTRVEIWVPEGSAAVGREYDPALHMAMPGNTARQRLIQSGRAAERG
ncbi:MAG TPA: hypothetical protein VFV34_23715 [Blastocatellia bacterium]|nr:hypothetical protein [Blastocatellia bacterium]